MDEGSRAKGHSCGARPTPTAALGAPSGVPKHMKG